MLRPKLLYFFYFAAMAALLPFLVVYYGQMGLSGRQVGALSALTPIMTLIAAPLWTALADAADRHRLLLLVTLGGTFILTFLTAWADSYPVLLASVGALAFFVAPVMPLIDDQVLTLLRKEKHRYGSLRLWGAVGWGVAALVAGLLVEHGVRWAFVLSAVFLAALWLAAFGLTSNRDAQIRGATSIRPFITRSWIGFFLVSVAGGVGLSVSTTFLYLYMADLGVRSSIIGASLTVATLSEVPLFFFASYLSRRYSAYTLLGFALLVFAVRLLLYGSIPAPWLLLGAQILHGPSFSLLWVAGVSYADTLAPKGLSATSQSLFSVAVMGWGGVVGSIVGGALYDGVGPAAMFRWTAAGITACAFMVVWVGFRQQLQRMTRETV